MRVCAAEHGRRRRAETISRTGEQWKADLVVVDEPWFWARTGEQVQTNDGDSRATHGGVDFVRLLTPSTVPVGFDLTEAAATETVAGRVCDVVAAIPREIDPPDFSIPGAEAFGVISGGRDFQLCLDRETSTLMRVTKFVDGDPAEVAEFLEIAFDDPLEQGLFRPLTEHPAGPSSYRHRAPHRVCADPLRPARQSAAVARRESPDGELKALRL